MEAQELRLWEGSMNPKLLVYPADSIGELSPPTALGITGIWTPFSQLFLVYGMQLEECQGDGSIGVPERHGMAMSHSACHHLLKWKNDPLSSFLCSGKCPVEF